MATRTDTGRRRFLVWGGLTGTAANYGAVHLKNPAASGYITIIKRIIVANHGTTGSSNNYYAIFGRKDTDLAAGAYTAQTLSVNAAEDAGGDSACVKATNAANSSVTDAPTVTMGIVALAKGFNAEVNFGVEGDDNSGVVLSEATGFVVKAAGAALTDIDVTFDVIEFKDLS